MTDPSSPPPTASTVYTGPLRAVIFDWAGTTVDFGSCAPVQAVRKLFAASDVPISATQAREPMGRAKRDHLAAVLAMPEVAQRWQQQHGQAPTEVDLDRLYADFLPTQLACLQEHSRLIDGCVAAVADCRSRGMKVGSSTGYTRELLDVVVAAARQQGYVPDVVLGASDVTPGRPAPWLCWENARRLDVYPAAAVVKVDDTVVGVQAGRNAGMWAIGVVHSGNEVGLSEPELAQLSPDERRHRCDAAADRLWHAGAHELVTTIAELPAALDRLSGRVAQGERP